MVLLLEDRECCNRVNEIEMEDANPGGLGDVIGRTHQPYEALRHSMRVGPARIVWGFLARGAQQQAEQNQAAVG
jgi:hypothetical protein